MKEILVDEQINPSNRQFWRNFAVTLFDKGSLWPLTPILVPILQEGLNALNEFRDLGVDFISYQENIDTTTPQGALIFGIFASLAQFESALISERVKAGMERARTQGKPLGRPRIPEHIKDEIQRLRNETPPLSPRQISKRLGIGYGTARRYVKALEAETK